ncbi:amino acid decarboxylase [Gemmatimonadetes bacterium T265]|nr:amino acid decarboxylase [Gemmatimonadetes bacterium T265]
MHTAGSSLPLVLPPARPTSAPARPSGVYARTGNAAAPTGESGAAPDAPERTLDPVDWNALGSLGARMLEDMLIHLRTVRERPVWQPTPADVRAAFTSGLPETPSSAESVYEAFRRNVLPYHTGNIHPRFWGWVMGTGSPTGMLAELLTAAMNGNAIGGDQASTYGEAQVLGWIKAMLGYPADASAILVTGGSVANLIGITAARNARTGIDADGHGLAGSTERPVLYCSTETHNCVAKAASLLGLGRRGVRQLPVDSGYALDLRALEQAIREDRARGLRPFCVVGNAGTVNTAAFDDLTRLADIAREHDLWFHVDGAFGALAALVPELRHLVAGMERADSLAVDLHKWLHMPYDVGCALVRDQGAHRAGWAQSASYLAPQARGIAAGSQWFSEYGPDLSRGDRALKVWMELQIHGRAAYADLVSQNVAQARYLAARIEQTDGLELAAPVGLNIVCLRMTVRGADAAAHDALNKELLLRLQESGVALPTSTVLGDRFVIRVAITNHRTRCADLDLFVDAVRAIAGELQRTA